MIVLHAAEIDGDLALWAECAATEPAPAGRRRRGSPPAHPFAAGQEDLVEALKLAGISAAPRPEQLGELIAWLPTAANRPAPSSPIVYDSPGSRARKKLAAWKVAGCLLGPAETADLLLACAGSRTLAPGWVIGADVAFWCQVLRFAGSMVARGQYLPSLEESPDGWRAQWRPHYQAEDEARIARLAGQMPAAAWALAPEASTRPPRRRPRQALQRCAQRLVDFLIRKSAAPGGRGRRRKRFESAHDAWLAALQDHEGALAADPGPAAQLSVQVGDWLHRFDLASQSGFRLCFRLEEPGLESEDDAADEIAGGDAEWYLRFMLQAREDPSLILELETAWRGDRAAKPLPGGYEVPSLESLLLGLGQAAALSDSVAAGLEKPEPGGHLLDPGQAHRFLTLEAAWLERAGFGVMLPAWWARRSPGLRLAARTRGGATSMSAAGSLSLDSLVEFDWELALGDQSISGSDLERLARLKAPLVRVRGQWMVLSTEQIAAATAFWQEKGATALTVRDLLHMEIGAVPAPADLEYAGLRQSGEVGSLLARLTEQGSYAPIEPAEEFQGRLRPYQARGLAWLAFLRRWGLGACLADDMGLGKTIQTLALLQLDRAARGPGPCLLVCPTSVIDNWREESRRFTPDLAVHVHHGAKRSKGRAFRARAAKSDLVISSYGLLHRDRRTLASMAWRGLVLDEAQNIKNPGTLQARAARNLEAEFRIALTGTPVENHVGDLWSIMEFLNPGLLGSQAAFKRVYLRPIQALGDKAAGARLRRCTGPFILRRLKTDPDVVPELPDKREARVYCRLTREQASLYSAVVAELEEGLAPAEGMARRGLVLATITKLKQICNHPAQFLGDSDPSLARSGKLARLSEMLEEVLSVGDRALVFTQFTAMGDMLQSHLQGTFGIEVPILQGKVSRSKRARMIERFQGGGPPLLLLSLRAGGTGLNLTAANHVFHFDRWWNPAVENQATDRAFRIGQTRDVMVHKFVCPGTIEDRIDTAFEKKRDIAEQIVGSGEGWLTGLDDDTLRDLFALSASSGGGT